TSSPRPSSRSCGTTATTPPSPNSCAPARRRLASTPAPTPRWFRPNLVVDTPAPGLGENQWLGRRQRVGFCLVGLWCGLRDRFDQLAGLLVSYLVNDVGLREDAHKSVVVEHGQPSPLPVGHCVERVVEKLVWEGRRDPSAGDLAGACGEGILLDCYH